MEPNERPSRAPRNARERAEWVEAIAARIDRNATAFWNREISRDAFDRAQRDAWALAESLGLTDEITKAVTP